MGRLVLFGYIKIAIILIIEEGKGYLIDEKLKINKHGYLNIKNINISD